MIKITCPICNDSFYAKRSAKRKYCSRPCFVADRLMGENNPKWKGDDVGYDALHDWVRIRLGSANHCEKDPSHIGRIYNWANISREYKRDLSDWKQLCQHCHKQYDMTEVERDRLRKLNIGRPPPNKGIPCSEEQKKRQSITLKRKYANGEVDHKTPFHKGHIPWNKGLRSANIAI